MNSPLVFLVAVCLSLPAQADDDLRYRAEIQIYQNRCQRGDYSKSKLEEYKDIERINEIGSSLGKTAFIATCGKKSEQMYTGGGYTPVAKDNNYKNGMHKPTVYVNDLEKYSNSRYVPPSDSTPIEHQAVTSELTIADENNINTPSTQSPSVVTSMFVGRCEGYGFQKGTDGFANCVMQMENAQSEANIQNQQRAQLERQCGFARSQGFLAPTRTGNFAESAQNANAAYSRCMAGLPPPHSYIINCNRNGSNFNCYAQ